MFGDFSEDLFDNLDFKEDSVREVIITPLLGRLGYGVSGPDRVIRSKSLVHPFIYAGTRRLPITLIPDYTLFVGDKAVLIIDAKRPTEDILSRANVQQAYSYAIHPEIKSEHFALCNGKSLVIFNVNDSTPILNIKFSEFLIRWDEIVKCISPSYLKRPELRLFAPDFGLALSMLGLEEGSIVTLLPASFNMVSKIDDEVYTASSGIDFAEKQHCVSFDFSPKLLPSLLAGLPVELAEAFSGALRRSPFQAAAELALEIDMETRLGPETTSQSEIFRPLLVERVIASRFNPAPLEKRADDIPDHVFKLRDAYIFSAKD